MERLAEESILTDFTWIAGDSRTNLAVVDPTSGEQTEINERGPDVTEEELERFLEKLLYLARGARACVIGWWHPALGPRLFLVGRPISWAWARGNDPDADGEPLSAAPAPAPSSASTRARPRRGRPEFNDRMICLPAARVPGGARSGEAIIKCQEEDASPHGDSGGVPTRAPRRRRSRWPRSPGALSSARGAAIRRPPAAGECPRFPLPPAGPSRPALPERGTIDPKRSSVTPRVVASGLDRRPPYAEGAAG
jgi:hypothetical protein